MSKKNKVDMESGPPEMNILNLIDIMFLTLLFLIFQPFKAPEMKLRNELPKDSGGPPDNSGTPKLPIRLQIRTTGVGEKEAEFQVDSDFLGLSDTRDPKKDAGNKIAAYLRKQSRGDKTTPIAIAAEAAVHYRHVLKALDQCYAAEMSDVKFEAPKGAR